MMPDAIDSLQAIVARRLGITITDARLGSLLAAASGLPALLDVGGIEDALLRLDELSLESAAWQSIVSAIVIGETRFLRQPDWFHQITRLALAPLIARRRSEGNHTLRCWSAGCSTGEEAYTLAMLVRDLCPDLSTWKIDILASDIQLEALAHAGKAVYSPRQLREADPQHLSRYFEELTTGHDKGHYKVSAEIRDIVRFVPASLVESANETCAGAQFDIIICRNVLMYMTPENQRGIARHLSRMLRPDGWLAVSPAEALAEWFKDLMPVNTADAILFQRAERRPRIAEIAPPRLPDPVKYSPPRGDKVVPRAAPRLAAEAPGVRNRLPEIRLLADRGELTEAKRRCLTLISDDALNGDANLLLAEIYAEIGNVRLAFEAARQAVYLAPASPMAHFLLGNTFAKQGHVAKARHAMQVALTLAEAGPTDTPVTPYSEITHRHLCVAAMAFLRHQSGEDLQGQPTHA